MSEFSSNALYNIVYILNLVRKHFTKCTIPDDLETPTVG